MQRSSAQSPTLGLILGLVITLAAVVAYSWYITLQIRGLRELQNNLADRSRKDSLQLLRIQDDLNSLGLAMRDMLDNDEPYPLTAWSAQFQRVRSDLDDAFRREEELAVAHRTPEQREYLGKSLNQFWDAVGRTFTLAQAGLFSSSSPAAAQATTQGAKAGSCDERCRPNWMDANLRLDQLQVVATGESYKLRPDSAVLGLIRMGGKTAAQEVDFALPRQRHFLQFGVLAEV